MEFTLNCLKADNSSEAHAPEEFFYGTDRKTDIVAPDPANRATAMETVTMALAPDTYKNRNSTRRLES